MVATSGAVDVTSENFNSVASLPPAIIRAGYVTGTNPIAWTTAMWNTYPNAIRIDQDLSASDKTADILDVENGAATPADCPVWVKAALANFNGAARPGQRSPAIYVNESNVTTVVNALIAGGVTSGVGLWVADWTFNVNDANATLAASGGPFPIIGVQYSDMGGGGAYDEDVFLTSWIDNVSKKATPPVPDPVVPNLVGETCGAAHNALVALGLIPTAPAYQRASDTVASTAPPSGTHVAAGSSVEIIGRQFHGEYVTGGEYDLADLANKLGYPVNTMLRMTACYYQTFGTVLGNFLGEILTGAKPWNTPCPKGVQIWCD